MTFSKPHSFLASLLIIAVLMTLPGSVTAHTAGPAEEEEFSSSRILSTGPLNIVYFEVSRF